MIYKSMRGEKVSAICYGGGSISKPEHISYIQCAFDNGINFVDTSENYNNGNSEIIIGEAIKYNRQNIFLSTKVGPENLNYNNVINSCRTSLDRLQTDYIDLYYIHWPNSAVPIKETCAALLALKEDLSLIHHIGVCNFNIEQLEEIYKILGDKILAVQSEYNFFDRSVENNIIPFCIKHGIFFIAFSPLRYAKYMDYDSSFILSWLISHQNIIAAISSLNISHIQEDSNAKIIDVKNIEKIPIELLDLDLIDYDNKKSFSVVTEVLAKDIKKYGMLKPIKVLYENDRYKIVDGSLRFLSWKCAYGNKPIEAIVLNR